jgi:hypothetical protein
MDTLDSPIGPQAARTAVRRLHEALAALGWPLDEREVAARRYGRTTRAAVEAFQVSKGLAPSGLVDAETAGALNAAVEGHQTVVGQAGSDVPIDPFPPAQRVSGTIVHADGTPLSGLVVQAFHRRVGGELPLGVEVASDDRGGFSITYQLPAGTSKVDLFVRAFDAKQNTVAVSPILIAAPAQAVLDLSVEVPQLRGPSAFARAGELLGLQLAGTTLEALDADDVALLVRNTGLARENVTAWIAAKRLAANTGVEHEPLYGLVRNENTAALPRLLRRPAARLRRSLEAAAATNLISREAGQRAPATVQRLKELAVELSASAQTPGSLGALLSTCSVAKPAQQAAFVARYAAHEGTVQALWAALRTDPLFGDAAVDDLQLALRLGTVAANHPPLVAALRASGVTRASQVAALDAAAWQKLLDTPVDGKPVGTPANIRGKTPEERAQRYVALLQERSARAFPAARVLGKLTTLPDWREATATAFLDANPEFDLLGARLDKRLDDPALVMQPGWDRARLKEELSTVQRIARVAPRGREAEVTDALLGQGYGSAFAIARQSRAGFRRRTAAAFGDAALADRVHRNAQYQVARTGNAYALMHPAIGGGAGVAALGVFSAAVTQDPTWASLFGNVDHCGCEHCASIHGPAAYFVDLLHWLDGHDAGGGQTVFDLLNRRRPDLQRIELSCANTHTVMPYVDLVLEILETRVLNPGGGPAGPASVPVASTATTPELLADPEFVHAAAYDDHLAKAVFPDLLPFDLWGALGRVYFEHLGVARAELMEALRRDGAPRADAFAAERLGLSMPQWRILTGAARHEVWQYWGYASAAPGGSDFKLDLAVVSHFLQRAGIAYEELLDLLHGRFVNPGAVAITGSGCDTDAMTIGPLSDDMLGQAHRFLRLWRRRGGSMLDLDKTLHALGITRLDGQGLERLADLDRAMALTGAPLLEALGWWAPLDTFADRPEKDAPVPSLYERVYLNRAVDAAAADPGFALALNAARDALADGTVPWSDLRTLLQAALAIDSAQLGLLLDETVGELPNPQRVVSGTTATLEGLSALYRHVSLARRLKRTVAELQALLRLQGIDPFSLADTRATIDFVEAAQAQRDSGFTLLELQYLLEHDAQADIALGVTDEAIGQVLVELRDGLARVAADFAVAADPVGEVTERWLAVLLDAAGVAAVMAALAAAADAGDPAELAATIGAALAPFVAFDADALVALAVPKRYGAMVRLIGPYLQRTQGEAVLIEKLAAFGGRSLEATSDLLGQRLRMTVDGRARPALEALRISPYTGTSASEIVASDDPAAFDALRRLHKASLLLQRLGLEIDAQVWLFDIGVAAGLLDPLALPVAAQPVAAGAWAAWARLTDLAALATALPGGEPGLVELLNLLETADEETFRASLVLRTGWLREDLDHLAGAFAPPFPAGWRDGRTLRRLVDAFALIGRLGVPAAQADGWAVAPIEAPQAEALRLAAKSKHDEQRWPAVARALRDPVREKQRAALVAHLIATDPGYDDEQALFEDLLIDVEMAPCMLSSRLKQAISSVQLYVHRAFLNLEPRFEPTREDQAQWEWMKNYRVWEAARKVFLYPENWIEPELRLDKSPLFEQLENSLMRGELDDAAAETAYTEYLEGLQKIARVEVMGLYHEYSEDEDGTTDRLHVVARTRAQPHEYVYRQWIDAREWTPWETLDAEIEGNHVILAVRDRRLMLFWPVVLQKASGDETSTSNFYEMKLAWMERLNGSWSPRRMSEGFLTVPGRWDVSDSSAPSASSITGAGENFTYFRLAEGAALTIECRQAVLSWLGGDLLGRFVFDSATGAVTVDSAQDSDVALVAPANNAIDRMRLLVWNYTSTEPTYLAMMTGSVDEARRLVGAAEHTTVLGHVMPGARVAYPHQFGEYVSQHAAFYEDPDCNFHIVPEPVLDWERLAAVDAVEPSDVGTTSSASDAIEPTRDVPEYETDIPWIKNQEAPILAARSAARIALPAGSAVVEQISAAAIEVPLEGLSFALTTRDLTSTQQQLTEVGQLSETVAFATTTKFRFANFHHPYVNDFMAELRRSGVEGLLDPNPDGPAADLVRQLKSKDSFEADYEPTSEVLNAPIQDIDFEPGGAYARYNWEIFFHAPLLIATRLSRNQRFEEARRWFHFMFDPTHRSDDSDPLRWWKIKPFYREADAPVEEFLALAAGDDGSPEAAAARQAYDRQVEAWLEDPFSPHDIAELRTTAYQKTLVMKYLDNLIAWGDQLFRQDTIESINEATQLYVTALQLLGERPDALPPRRPAAALTFEQVRAGLADAVLSNPLVQLENLLPLPRQEAPAFSPLTMAASAWTGLLFPLPPTGLPVPNAGSAGFYFCIPPNQQLMAYWDLVEDRLFKIRHCMNIQGVVRQLPLFEPPIDPGMLVRARAAGIDLASALADLNAPLPHYRFSVMLQKAHALNQSVRALGGALLSALEKGDAEALALLRANHEVAVLESVRQVRKLAIEEARHGLEAAQRSLETVQQRRDYYAGLIADGPLGQETAQLALQVTAGGLQTTAAGLALTGGILAAVPRVNTGASGVMGSPVATADVVDGSKLAKALELGAKALEFGSTAASVASSTLGITSGWARRKQEWEQQRTAADKELAQINRQIQAADVRVALSERELENHERQIENARAVREFMEHKFTGTTLYQWMSGQLATLYFQSYQLAYDLAKQAERAYRHELALPQAVFIQFGYWDSLKKGLLAAERLQFALEHMDKAYLENNLREYELTRHVSLALLDPVALVQLQTAGRCEFSLPEALYDLDHPGHYLRRLKSVSVSVPCVTGPYTAVPMRLTLVASRTRTDPVADGSYPLDPTIDDPRFQFQTGAVQSIAISGANNDGGLFNLDHRDERYLPFEGSGAVGDWSLEISSAVPTFDWTSISDVLLHVRYTAREGGELLRTAALASLNEELAALPLRRAFSARSEFATPWNAFLRPGDGSTEAVFAVDLEAALFPHLAQDAELAVLNLELVALVKDPEHWPGAAITVSLGANVQLPDLVGSAALYGGQPSAAVSFGTAGVPPGRLEIALPNPLGALGDPAQWADDLVLLVTYGVTLQTR